MTKKQKEMAERLLKQAEMHLDALVAHLEKLPADRNEFPWLEKAIKLNAQIEYLQNLLGEK